MTDDVFIGVVDLFRIGFFRWPEGDQAAGELLPDEAVCVADLIVEVFEAARILITFIGV